MRSTARWVLLSLSSFVTVVVGCGSSTLDTDQATRTSGTVPPGAEGAPDGAAPSAERVVPPGAAIDHILSTGQSNAVGFNAKPALSLQPSMGNLMFDRGVMTSAECDSEGCKHYDKPSKLVGLVEGDTYLTDKVETMSTGMANEITRLSGGASRILVSNHGRSGNTYWCLSKVGCSFLDGHGYVKPFDEALLQIADAQALAKTAGVPYKVRAVTAIHGESDHYAGQFPLDGSDGTKGSITNYADALVEWQRDYEDAVHTATGQTESVPLFISQMANWNDTPHSEIPSRQLEASLRSPGKIIVVGPTYQLPYTDDCIHFSSHGERQLGEYFARAYHRVIVEKGAWEPLRPKTVAAAGNVVTISFLVPKPPLVLDTKLVTDPGQFGFEVVDAAGSPLAIESVAVAGADSVTITLAAGWSATGGHVRYAATAQPETCPGPQTGPRGNLRDSDDTPSNYGYSLFNWSVSFDAAIP
ncbi:MAG: hypothetical protein JWP87_5658 [Labilithrix sp.]|nr:hypothetical protein [Labilithrix sp.]